MNIVRFRQQTAKLCYLFVLISLIAFSVGSTSKVKAHTELFLPILDSSTELQIISGSNGFSDQFNGSQLNSGWTWVDPLGDSTYSLSANPGKLRLFTPDSGHDLYQNFNAPRLVQTVSGDFEIKTKVMINPQFNYQGAGLLIWQDSNNYIRLERTLVSGIDLWYRVNGNYQGKEITFSSSSPVYLKLSRSGNDIVASYSTNNSTWINVLTVTFPANNALQVGLVLINEWQDHPIYADFDFFELKIKPPLILVHGWQGTAFGGGYHCNQGIQKYNGSNSTLNSTDGSPDLADWFVSEGYDVWIAHLESTPDGTPPLLDNAKCLQNQIEYVHSENNGPITIVSHSMGGLVSRAAIRLLNNNITKDIKLFTLGSPHAGLPKDWAFKLYGLFLSDQDAVYEMTSDRMNGLDGFNGKFYNIRDVDYYFIGGTTSPWFKGSKILYGFQKNDGLVSSNSAVGWVSTNVFDPPNWVGTTLRGQYWTDETHSAFYDEDNNYYTAPPGDLYSSAFVCMKALINHEDMSNISWACESAGTTVQSVSAQIATDTSTSNFSAFTELKTGHLDASQSISIPLEIDTSAESLFYLTWNGDAPSFTLTRSDNQVIDPAYATSHPTEVSYEMSLGGGDAPPFAAYDFASTQPGTWYLNITAIGGIDYQGFAALESTRILTVQTDKDDYQIGETATITANLASSGASLSGATITATLTRPDNIVDVVSLADQGNGTYSNTYTIPDAPGYLAIDVTANGSDNGTDFSRQENLLVAVAPNDLQLTGNYGDQPRDDNADGFYDFLDFTMEINLATAGEYAVSVELYAGDQLITQSGDFFDLPAGTQTITLPFDGGAIREAGLNGPYTIKNLYLTPIDIGITAASVENAWTTQAYSYTQFANTTYTQVSFLSSGVEDGWIRESTEFSNVGGALNKNATTLRVGDDSANKQYRSILSFDTTSLPENAEITSVTLRFKNAGKTGTLPFSTHGKLLADMCRGPFKNNPALQLGDFNAKCGLGNYKAKALIFTNTLVSGWYEQSLLTGDYQYLNLGGVTQFRLRFSKDDNNDFGADFLKLFSGNAAEADRPQLVIEYYVP